MPTHCSEEYTRLAESVSIGHHSCQLFRTRNDALNLLVSYFNQGLQTNHSCVWICSKLITAAQAELAIRDSIERAGRDIDSGRMSFVSYEQWHLKQGKMHALDSLTSLLQAHDEALRRGAEALRVGGDLSSVTPNDWDQFMIYERFRESLPRQEGCRNSLLLHASPASGRRAG